MPTEENARHPLCFASPSTAQSAALLSAAAALQRAAGGGRSPALLTGKRLGLMGEMEDGAEAALFGEAARELGIHVSMIRPCLSESSTAQEVQHTARMLGRLYDAIDCQGLTPSLARRIADESGVPVYLGLVATTVAALAAQLDGDAPMTDKRRFVLQAVLLSTLQ